MWTAIVTKLKAIEDNLVGQDSYVDKFDAMSLASVEISDRSEESCLSHSFIPTTQLKGLTKLVSDISAVLHEAYIEQQGSLIKAKSGIDKCHNVSYFRDQNTFAASHHDVEEKGVKLSVPSSSQFTETGTSFWDHDDISEGISSSSDIAFKTGSAERHFRLSMQEIHNNLVTILDTKLIAHEIVISSMETYLRYTTKIAKENGVLDPLQRANCLVQPQLAALLTHKFLITSETHDGLSAVRNLLAKAFYHNNVDLAERKLLLNQNILNQKSSRGMTKFKMGAGLTMLLWSFSECFNNEQIGDEIWRDPTFAIFMCIGDLILLLWMWGLSMRVWRKAGIDFVRLLALEGTEVEGNKSPESSVYSSATDLSLIFLVIFICFNKAVRGVLNIHGSRAFAHILPTLMVVFFFYRAYSPSSSRRKWLRMLRQVLVAPWAPVGFRDGYIGDLLTSLVRVLIPMCFSFAYLIMSAYAWLSNNIKAASSTSDLWWQDSFFYRYLLVPLVTLYPLWIRLMQCLRRSVETGKRWPHQANALKYASAIGVISYGTFRPHLREDLMWIVCFVCATIFQFTWDLTMDWGMLVRSTSKAASDSSFLGISLRRNRLLGSYWRYITVIFANFILRFAWALTLLPENRDEGPKTVYTIILFHLTPLVAALEVMRRMVWGFFRLEYEQLETLGAPDFSSLSLPEAMHSHKSFDKMETSVAKSSDSSEASRDGRSSGGYSSHHAGDAASDIDHEWILSVAVLSTLSEYVIQCSTLNSSSSVQTKARLVEAVFFAAFLLCVVISAALPGNLL